MLTRIIAAAIGLALVLPAIVYGGELAVVQPRAEGRRRVA